MSRFRVGFDVTSAVKRRGRGIAAYVRALLTAFPEAVPEVDPVLYVRGKRWLRRRHVADLLPHAKRRWILGSWGSSGGDLDAFHGLGVRLPASCRAPRSFTMHDFRVLDSREWDTPRWIEVRGRRIRESVARADRIVCLSGHGRARLTHHFPEFPIERSTVVAHGVDHERFRPYAPEEALAVVSRHGIDRPYLLQVGQLAPHKNAAATLRTFARSQASAGGAWLVLVGGAVEGHREVLETQARSLGIADQIRWLEQVSHDELPAFYAGAEATLFPSLYEGFGLPVLEAMACGSPGVVAATTCLPEVAGSAWPAVAADDHEAMARIVDRLLIDPNFRADTVRRSLERAAGFTWERCARETVDFLRAAVGSDVPSG